MPLTKLRVSPANTECKIKKGDSLYVSKEDVMHHAAITCAHAGRMCNIIEIAKNNICNCREVTYTDKKLHNVTKKICKNVVK